MFGGMKATSAGSRQVVPLGSLLLLLSCATAPPAPLCQRPLTQQGMDAEAEHHTRWMQACKESGAANGPLPAPDVTHACWYGEVLAAMGEKALWAEGRAAYRFLWLRAFHEPVLVRLDRDKDGTGTLTAHTLDGVGGHFAGCLNRNVRRPASKTEVAGLISRATAAFAIPAPLPTTAPPVGELRPDGARWVFEEVNGSERLVRDVWSPDQGPATAAYRELGLYLVKLAGFQIPESETY